MSTQHISCHCGHVKIKLTGSPLADLYCHCYDCQRIAGAGCVPYSVYPTDAVEITEGETRSWALVNNPRIRCARCSTLLFGNPVGMGIRGISAYLLPKGTFKPQMHIMCKDALVPVKDDLPHFAGFPAAFGGSDDKVAW